LRNLWRLELPHEGNLPATSTFYEVEIETLKRMSELGVMPKQFYKEALEEWEKLKGES